MAVSTERLASTLQVATGVPPTVMRTASEPGLGKFWPLKVAVPPCGTIAGVKPSYNASTPALRANRAIAVAPAPSNAIVSTGS